MISRNLLGLLLCCSMTAGTDEGRTRTNEVIYNELCREAIVHALEMVRLPDTSNVALKLGEDTLSNFFRQTILESIHNKFKNVVLGTAHDRISLSFGVARVNLRYGSPFTDGLFGSRMVERAIAVELEGNAIGGDNRIVWAGKILRHSVDTIAVSEIPALEKSSKHIATSPVSGGSFFEKILEPVVVIAASAVVIYLFFTIRS